MKKILTSLALSGMLAMQAAAIQVNDKSPLVTEVDWTIIDDFVNKTTTYTTTIIGNYDFQLGAASLLATQGESGTISVVTTGTDWATPYGIGVVANVNPYDMQGYQAGNVGLYVCHPETHVDPCCIEFYINNYRYYFDGRTTTVTNEDAGISRTVTLPRTVYSQEAHTRYGNGAELTFGYTMSGAFDDDGNLLGMKFSTPEGADAWLEGENGEDYAILPNMGKPFDLTELTSTGLSYVDTKLSYGISNDAVTTITITKSLRAEAVPEPASATLSLLALAGLAARRRRK